MVASDSARLATPADAGRIAAIYNQGIEDRIATFETELRTVETVRSWFDQPYPIVVVERGGEVIAWANASLYRPRACYAGNCEFSVYVDRAHRGTGAGRGAMEALMDAARDAGYTKLIGRVFVENTGSRKLLRKLGFREVGVYVNHGQLDGEWRDVVIVERLLDGDGGSGLHAGQVIKVVKTNADGSPPETYPGTVIPCDLPGWIVVEAVWTLPDTDVAGVIFEQGGRLVEYFSTQHAYNVIHVHGRDGASRGFYANVTAPTVMSSDAGGTVLVWEDRWLDVVKLPDGTLQYLDEDELAAADVDDRLRAEIIAARDELAVRLAAREFG